MEQQQPHRHTEQTCACHGEGCEVGRDWGLGLADADGDIQAGKTASSYCVAQGSVISSYDKPYWERVSVCIPESLCCTAEINIVNQLKKTECFAILPPCTSHSHLEEAVWVITDHSLQNPWVCVIHLFSSSSYLIPWLFVSVDSVLLFRAASRNLFWKLKSIFVYRCSSMHYCKRNIEIDLHIKIGFSWFMESMMQTFLCVDFLSKEFFDYKFFK